MIGHRKLLSTIGIALLCSSALARSWSSDSGLPLKTYPPIFGDLADKLYDIQCNGEDCEDSVDLYGGCHYGIRRKKLRLRFCEFPNGFINSPIRDIISELIIRN